MEQSRITRFGSVVQYPEFEKNVKLAKIKSKIEKVLIQNGFAKCHIPYVGNSGLYLSDGRFDATQDLYKVIAGDGQVLTLPGDPTAALLNSIVVKRNENERYFGTTETFSFLKANNPQNGYYLTAVLTCAEGYQPQVEMCALALEIAEVIGLNAKIHISNTEIAQGVVNYYTKRAESKEKTKMLIDGVVSSESDYAASQIFTEIKRIGDKPPKECLKLVAEKIENQRSLDGILDVYEVLNLLELHGMNDKVIVDPLYIGQANQSGTVFSIGEEVSVIYGGKSTFSNGQEKMNIMTLTVDLMQLGATLPNLVQERSTKVCVLVSTSVTAYQKALKFKADFLKNGLATDIKYNVTPEEAEKIMSARNGKDYLVVYVEEDGNVIHN